MNTKTEPCQFLQWDTDFFGHRIARVNGQRLDRDCVEAIYAWCEDQAIECLYFLAASDDPQTIRLAEDHDFRLVEVRISLERSLKDWDPETRPKAAEDVFVRPVRPEDIPILQGIAGHSYIDSRFYFDKCFPQEKWQAYYETWVRKSCEGGADLALVAEKDGQVVGYITGLVSKDKPQGQYELTGVEPAVRRAGVGQELFRSGLDWYVRSGVEYIWVDTQGRNVVTQRMIQRHGFLTRSCQLYYHKWFSSCNA
jgi:GNAT superfamily N-acetyltransferase